MWRKEMVAGNTTKLSERDLDFYPTDPAWVHVLLRHEKFDGEIDETCCGDGAISKVLKDHEYKVNSFDIKCYGYPKTHIEDTLHNAYSRPNVVTNPPYNKATEMINHWLQITEGKVAVLMRLSYIEGVERYEQFKGIRPHKIILVTDRMKHKDRNTGKMVSSQFPQAWLIWDNSKPPVDESILIWDRV